MSAATTARIHLPNSTTGSSIPVIGLGTWRSPDDQVVEAVRYALAEAGYKHIDAADAYMNEKAVGEGIKASGVPRSEFFLTSKVWGTGFRDVNAVVDKILGNLGTDYLDLLLMHWPVPLNPNGNNELFPSREDGSTDFDDTVTLSSAWAQFEAILASGKAKNIGVSNCSQWMLETQIMPKATVKPAVNQIELHPYLPQHKLLAWMKSEGIVAQAYSPLGSEDSEVMKDEVVLEIARAHNAKPAQVLIGWAVAKDIVALPKSVTPLRIAQNAKPVHLTATEVERLDKLAESGKGKRFITAEWGVKLGFEDWV